MSRQDEEFAEEPSGDLPSFLTDPVGMLRRRGVWAALLAVVSIGLGCVAVHLLVPIAYVATAVILVRNQQISDKFVAPSVTANPLASVDSIVGEALARDQLLPLLDEFHLYPNLSERLSRLEVVERFRDDIEVAPTPRLNLSYAPDATIFNVSFRYPDAVRSAAVANAIASRFLAMQSENRMSQARSTTEFLTAELQRSEREMRAQDGEIAAYKLEHRGELPSEFTGNTARLERLDSLRQALATQISSAESRLALLAQGVGAPGAGGLATPTSRLEALRSALAHELTVNTENHPNVLSLRREIESLEKELAVGNDGDVSADAMVRAAQREVEALRRQLTDVERESRELEAKVAQTPRREEEMAAMEQRAEVLRETYLANLRKVKQAELAQSVESAEQGGRVEVIERAAAPDKPDRKRLKLFLVVIGGSIGAGIALAVLLEQLDPVVTSTTNLDDELGLPWLGSVSRVP